MRAVLAALLFSTTVGAAAPTWSVARSPHFEVYTSGAPDRAVEALGMFEDARTFFTAYLNLPDSSRPPIRVILFSGALYGIGVGGPRWLGMIAPLGGVSLILGWCALAFGSTPPIAKRAD